MLDSLSKLDFTWMKSAMGGDDFDWLKYTANIHIAPPTYIEVNASYVPIVFEKE